ncbi:hypothetical protein MBM09_08365 [Flaviramulus sp. BrNp1-15]|uniref:hypothetical protein n=1 Tax=Flaviramulus sp. BrNp1-15 TaxID=2916754 RepID=UPI001EE784CC|nr:hypothetical protein [Flaviramulus sp. BrNp1-15]ULC57933.1 hypothetical protein MBM09_08365 [Flaviramulus sp. BrNp1-15]
MVVLKKIKASTLMETLVATVLIVVVFIIASMILNNLFSNTIKNNTRNINAKLNELEYLYINDKINIPAYDDYKFWEIAIERDNDRGINIIKLEAVNSKASKTVTKEIIEN